MIVFVCRKVSVVDVFFLLLLIVPHPQKKLTTTAAPSNLTQCVMQDNDRGLNFGCSPDSMAWVRIGYSARSPSTSPSQFCENPTSSANDCIPDPRTVRAAMASNCNTYSNCLLYGKSYSDIVSLCPSNNGGFPFAFVSYECLPRTQADGGFILPINSFDTSVTDYYGKINLFTYRYPYDKIDKNAQFQITVDGNTMVSLRLLDAYGQLLDAAGSCSFTLYVYSSLTNIYREWCVNRTSWSVDDSIPVVFPAASQGSGSGSTLQNIDIVFSKTNPSFDAQGFFWILVDTVNVVDNSPGRNINVSVGNAFTPQVRRTTTTSTTTTTTTTTTPTTTTPTTTTPTTTTPTTTTTTPTTTTTTPTTTTTTPTTTTTTPTTTTPTTTTTTPTTTTTTPTKTTPTTTTSTTTTTTTTTPAATSPTTTARTTPTTTTATSTTTTTTTTTPVPSLAPATSSTVTSSSVTSSRTQVTSNDKTTDPVVPLPTTTFSPTSTSTEGVNANSTAPTAGSSQNTNVIIGVVVAVAGVVIIIIIVVVVVVICRRNPDRRKSKPRPPMMMASIDFTIANHSNNDDDAESKLSSKLYGRDHIYDEIPEPSVGTIKTVSYPPQQHHPASPTIMRIGRSQSRKAANGAKVRFTTPGGDEDLVFFPGVASNISDDDKANRQTAQNANEVHPRLIKVFSPSKRLSFSSRQDSVPSTAGDPDTGIQLNPVYGFRPDIYMY